VTDTNCVAEHCQDYKDTCLAVVMSPCFISAMSFVCCVFFGVRADVTHIQSTALD
jgi:hypothetical protein